MAYFPFFVDIKGQKCLIVGGGMVAYRKVAVLLDYGPDIEVVAPQMNRELADLEGRIVLKHRNFEDGDLAGVDFVVAATEDAGVNRHISELCREMRILVNVVDVKEECSFIFPALIKESDITIGISTGGNSPTVAQYLKRAFKSVIPPDFKELVTDLGAYRELVKERIPSLSVRTAVFKEMVDLGIAHGGKIQREQVEELIRRKLDKTVEGA